LLRKKQDSLVNLVQPINGVILALWGFIRKGIFGFFSLYDSVFGSRMRSRRDDVGIVPYGGLGAGRNGKRTARAVGGTGRQSCFCGVYGRLLRFIFGGRRCP